MCDKVSEWADFFKRMFSEARKIILERYRFEEDGSGPPETLAIRRIVTDFPCPVRVAEIRIDTEKHEHIKDEVCQVVRYDFSGLGTSESLVDRSIEYCGFIDAKQSEKLKEILVKNFDLKDNWFDDFYRDFKIIGWSDDEVSFYTQFLLYDIRKDFTKFVYDFISQVFSSLEEKIIQESRKGIDWSSEFNLEPDPIQLMSKITNMDRTLEAFPSFSKGAGIEELQKDICTIQLIPSVPENVTKVFRHAKDLHIYGFFCYGFFTISQHYAYLALESAIKTRYYQSFGREITLENEKHETVKMGRIDHQGIMDFCRRRKGWDVRRLWINGKRLAYNTKELLDWLVGEKIITLWERRRCYRGMTLRNIMSHLTRTHVFPPSYSVRALEFVGDLINRLYSTCRPGTDDDSKPVFPADLSPENMS
jgi:hypothetical protein